MRLGDCIAAEFAIRQWKKENPGYCALMEFEDYKKSPRSTKANEIFGNYVDEIIQYKQGQTSKKDIIDIANNFGADILIGWANTPAHFPFHEVIDNYRWMKGLQEPFKIVESEKHILEKNPFEIKYSGPPPELADKFPRLPSIGELKHNNFKGAKYLYACLHTIALAYRAKGINSNAILKISKEMDEWWKSQNIKNYVVFHARSLPKESWFSERALSQETTNEIVNIIKKFDCKIIVLGSSMDTVTIENNGMIIDYRKDDFRLEKLATIIKSASLFVGPISSFNQIASSFNVKTILLPPIFSLCEPNMVKENYILIHNFNKDILENSIERMLK